MKPGPKGTPTAAKLPRLRARTPSGRVLEFFKAHLVHVKGELAGTPLVLAPWQRRDIVQPLFDTCLPSGLRQYRTCYVEIPRKNAKSTLAAGLALFLLFYDDEPGAEIVSAAADRQQAHVTFDIARSMVEASPTLRERTRIYRRELVTATGSLYRVISAEAYSKHGMNLSGAIVDELHAHENRELLDVLTTSMGGRRQPVMFIITTAGFDKHSVCWQMHEHAERVRAGILEDASFLPVLYGTTVEDDWTSPAVWAHANPGLGVTVKADYLEQECRRAKEMPSYENAFRRLHLNVWTESETRWLSMEQWDLGAVEVEPAALRGRRCFVGVDLSSTKDLSACVAIFPDADNAYDVLAWFWLPEDHLPERVRRDRVPFDVWARQDGGKTDACVRSNATSVGAHTSSVAFLTLTSGNVIDHDVIERRIRDLAEVDGFTVESVGIDPWNATQMLARLQADGIPAIPVPQTMAGLTAATKALEAAVLSGKLRHGGHPLLRWCASNVTVETDANENVKPSKKKSTERIDGISALVNAFSQALPAISGSVYDSRAPLLVDL